jgi:hypothetical protein
MTSAAKRKPAPPIIPSLAERAQCLFEDMMDSPPHERRELLTWWRESLDDALDHLAEELRPKGEIKVDATGQDAIVGSIPVGWTKMQLHARGHGDCPCRAMAEALKES